MSPPLHSDRLTLCYPQISSTPLQIEANVEALCDSFYDGIQIFCQGETITNMDSQLANTKGVDTSLTCGGASQLFICGQECIVILQYVFHTFLLKTETYNHFVNVFLYEID